MRMKTELNGSVDKHVKEIKRKTRRQFSAEEKIWIVLDSLRGAFFDFRPMSLLRDRGNPVL